MEIGSPIQDNVVALSKDLDEKDRSVIVFLISPCTSSRFLSSPHSRSVAQLMCVSIAEIDDAISSPVAEIERRSTAVYGLGAEYVKARLRGPLLTSRETYTL